MTPEAKAQAASLVAAIPSDNRDKTARICGDPVFERSALFQKLKEHGSTPIRRQHE